MNNDDKSKLTKEEFINNIEKVKIQSLSEDENILTEDNAFKHLVGEIMVGNDKYLLMNGSIIMVNNNYTKKLDKHILDYLEKNKYSTDMKKWKKGQDEGEYISEYKNDNNCFIVHPNKVNNVELCDIIRENDDGYDFIFIKQGVDYKVRDLSNQIIVSNNILLDSNKMNYINKFYNNLDNIPFDKEDLLRCINSGKINYIFAVYNDKNTDIEEAIEKSKSLIGKMSISMLIDQIRMTNYGLKFVKIQGENNENS